MKVVNCTKEPFDVYIGRGSEFGSPFVIGVHGTREEVLVLYEEYARSSIKKEDILALDGKVLGCWCKPLACHGDILLKLIEEYKKL